MTYGAPTLEQTQVNKKTCAPPALWTGEKREEDFCREVIRKGRIRRALPLRQEPTINLRISLPNLDMRRISELCSRDRGEVFIIF